MKQAKRGRARSVWATVTLGCLLGAGLAMATPPPASHGVLVHLQSNAVKAFDARHNATATQISSNRDLYVVTSNNGESDAALLADIQTDPAATNPSLNVVLTLNDQQSTASVLNDDQSTASVLNDQSTASVLNDDQSTASVLNGWVNYYTSKAPAQYVNQPLVGQIAAGPSALALATGKGVVVAVVDDGVDQFNPVLRNSLVQGYNAIDNNHNASAWADLAVPSRGNSRLGQSTASVLNDDQSTASVLNDDQSTASVLNGDQSTASVLNGGQSTASVLNGWRFRLAWDQSTASVLNQSTASVLNCKVPGSLSQSTASVLNDQSTASVLNDDQSTASVLNGDQSTASVLNDDQSTASVLNDQSTASVLNDDQSTASVLNSLSRILACNPDFGHGTSVAGLVHLVAPQASIMPIKAFSDDGTADAATIVKALDYAIDHGVNVMNLSFSATATTPEIQGAIAEAESDGIVVAAAAGNDDTTTAVFPASLSGVLGAGAVDGCSAATTPTPAPGTVNPCASNPLLKKALFSNYDPASGNVDVTVSAPGVQLFTTFPGFGLVWATVSGTSFSTPLVAGEAALLAQVHAGNNNSFITGAVNPVIGPDAGGKLLGGNGMIQVTTALQNAKAACSSGHGSHGGC